MNARSIEGKLVAGRHKFAIVASRFNEVLVDQLIRGASDYLLRHGTDLENITYVKVPGAFEIPATVKILAETKKFAGIICVGVIMRGATMHYELLANEVIKNLAQINLACGLPVGYGILTAETLEQAFERAGTKAGNKGAEAAAATLEMIDVLQQIKNLK